MLTNFEIKDSLYTLDYITVLNINNECIRYLENYQKNDLYNLELFLGIPKNKINTELIQTIQILTYEYLIELLNDLKELTK